MKKVENFGTKVQLAIQEDGWLGVRIEYATKSEADGTTLESNVINVNSQQALDIYNAIKYLYDLR
jgi:hypothetical protein